MEIWCVSYSHECGVQQHKMIYPPGTLGRGQKVKYHNISITKSVSKIFIPNFIVFSQIKDITNRQDFSFIDLGHAPWVGLGGAGGKKHECGDLQWGPIDGAF